MNVKIEKGNYIFKDSVNRLSQKTKVINLFFYLREKTRSHLDVRNLGDRL
jgi:hypothetical protein